MDLNSLPLETRLCEAQSEFWEPNLKLRMILSDSIGLKGLQDTILIFSLVNMEY